MQVASAEEAQRVAEFRCAELQAEAVAAKKRVQAAEETVATDRRRMEAANRELLEERSHGGLLQEKLERVYARMQKYEQQVRTDCYDYYFILWTRFVFSMQGQTNF